MLHMPGKKNRKEKEISRPQTPPLDFFNIGKTGTEEMFRAANRVAFEHISEPEKHDTRREYVEHLGANDQKQLREGAIQALLEGHPENFLAIMQYPEEFAIRNHFVNMTRKYPENTRANVVSEIAKRSSNLRADLEQALAATPLEKEQRAVQEVIIYTLDKLSSVPGKEKARNTLASLMGSVGASPQEIEKHRKTALYYTLQELASIPEAGSSVKALVRLAAANGFSSQEVQDSLNKALYNVVSNHGTDAAVAALLDNGAEANAALNGDGYKGRILATAVRKETSPAVIDRLHENHANFVDALDLMKTKPGEEWSASERFSLKAHFKRITGQPLEAPQDPSALEQTIAELQDEVTKVRKDFSKVNSKLGSLTSEVSDTNRNLQSGTYGHYRNGRYY